ncbi:MAG: ATP-binding protein [Raineya sp.]|jgi:energy-coupling factor transporter ATP-binding protein EcfA2|nr:ATP-binding protein [Raineya sp.]
MIFEFENLGSIKKAELEVGNLTVICGKNNTGKTYLTYAVWGMLARRLAFVTINPKHFSNLSKEIAKQLNSSGKAYVDLKDYEQDFIQQANKYFGGISQEIHKIFDINKKSFTGLVKLKYTSLNFKKSYNSVFNGDNQIEITKDEKSTRIDFLVIKKTEYNISESEIRTLLDFILSSFLQYPFIITAQRDALHIFNYAINREARYRLRDNSNFSSNTYTLPLESHIDFISSLLEMEKRQSFLSEKSLIYEIETLLGVKYIVRHNGFVIETSDNIRVPAYLASTSVRALADLNFYLKHIAQEGHLLMIDEPELNLHPENQIKVARLLVKLVNAGLKVWITTHSDYIIKELNNCLMLSNKKIKGKKKLMKDLGYKDDEVLNPDDLRYYTAVYDKKLEGCTLVRGKVGKYGVEAQSFDETLEKIVETSETIINVIE